MDSFHQDYTACTDLPGALVSALKNLSGQKPLSINVITDTARFMTTASAGAFYEVKKEELVQVYGKSTRPLPERCGLSENSVFILQQNETTGVPGPDSLFFGEWILNREFKSGVVIPLILPKQGGLLVLNSAKSGWFQGNRYRFCELYKDMVETLAGTFQKGA